MKNIILTAAALLAITGISTVKASETKTPLTATLKMDSAATMKTDSAATMKMDSVFAMNTDSAATRRTDSASTMKMDSAATMKTDSTMKVKQDSSQKVPVKLEQLPAPVTTTLKADAYKDWTPTTAFLVTAADKSQFYQIDVTKGTEKAFIKINKDGVVVQ
ncbi:hypothetical protein [Pedobacter cryoconitis]|uniref:PepSY-like beta-lactamase-inhibitor n=1 Tax=Pedobacter cryoconitis TaxID=188932 RepID=A0A327SV78_9SPHI|nr:hypothetical protein [Pedobacter cryoconitis]RAJ29527.1 hypothetical protein LY11_02790 [Pedobacter cryoconitis]